MSKESGKFFAALLTKADTGSYLQMGDISAVFSHVPSEMEHFNFIKEFITEYGKLPKLSTFNEATNKNLKETEESPEYYYDKLVQRHIKKTLMKSSREASSLIQDGDIFGGFEIIKKAVKDISLQKSAPQITDFKNSHDLLKTELLLKNNPDYGINTGWDYFDSMNGALRPGDLFSITGRPGAGKSWLLLKIALHAWMVQKKDVLIVSMEMDTVSIMERLAALYQKVPYNRVKLGEFPTLRSNKKKEFLQSMLDLKERDMPELNVIDGNLTTSIEEIINISKQLKPGVVLVDGAYLVTTDNHYKSYERIGYVANTLKSKVGANEGIPVIATWQLNKEATKLKKGQKVGTEHIGGADEIGKVSSVAVGLFHEDSPDNIKQRKITIMKGRGGEAGEFYINWDFNSMDLDEIKEINDYEIMIT